MNDLRTQLVTLLERRDLAAYRAVSKIQMVLQFWEAQDYENAEQLLRSALAEFEDVDRKINALYREQTKTEKRPANGITTASKQPDSAAS